MHVLYGRHLGAAQPFFQREYSDGDAQKILSAFESSPGEHDPRIDEERLRFPGTYFVLHTQSDLESSFGPKPAGWHKFGPKADEATIKALFSK